MARARLYLWDGYRFGPMIQTDSQMLEERIVKVRDFGLGPQHQSALFIAQSVADGIECVVWNAPPGRTSAGMFAAAVDRNNWPGDPETTAGVFVANMATGECQMIGGAGFGDEPKNPGQMTSRQLWEPEALEPGEDEQADAIVEETVRRA